MKVNQKFFNNFFLYIMLNKILYNVFIFYIFGVSNSSLYNVKKIFDFK